MAPLTKVTKIIINVSTCICTQTKHHDAVNSRVDSIKLVTYICRSTHRYPRDKIVVLHSLVAPPYVLILKSSKVFGYASNCFNLRNIPCDISPWHVYSNILGIEAARNGAEVVTAASDVSIRDAC